MHKLFIGLGGALQLTTKQFVGEPQEHESNIKDLSPILGNIITFANKIQTEVSRGHFTPSDYQTITTSSRKLLRHLRAIVHSVESRGTLDNETIEHFIKPIRSSLIDTVNECSESLEVIAKGFLHQKLGKEIPAERFKSLVDQLNDQEKSLVFDWASNPEDPWDSAFLVDFFLFYLREFVQELEFIQDFTQERLKSPKTISFFRTNPITKIKQGKDKIS